MFKLMAAYLLATSLALGAEKISLQKRTESLQKRTEISQLYKSSVELGQNPASELPNLLNPNKKALEDLKKDFSSFTSFIRGEIENEETLKQLLGFLQLSMLRARAAGFEGKWADVQSEMASWFLFAADFPYEESSLVGLRVTHQIRTLLLDELEKIQKKFASEIAKDPALRAWFLQIRAPWPVDRVFVTEAKRLLKPPMMSVANAAAKAFQQNPYQTSAKALARVRGGQSQEAQLLKDIWRESDINLMKTESNRIGQLKLRFALAEYEFRHKKSASSVQELVNAQLLDKPPVDYFSGKPLGLTSL